MVRLVRADLPLTDAALAGDDSLARALGHDVVSGWATFTGALRPARDSLGAPSRVRFATRATFRASRQLAAEQVVDQRLHLLLVEAALERGHHAGLEALDRERLRVEDRLVDVLLG
jgi:hypothetical protein